MTVRSNGSVSRWIDPLKQGDPEAVRRLWDAYSQRLVRLARDKLRGVPRQMADEEDVALSAFDSLCRGVEKGQFPRLDDRNDLWRLLVTVTVRKAIDHAEHERRASRGGGRTLSLTALSESELCELLGDEPTADLAVQIADQCRHLLMVLQSETLRKVALWKMEGHTIHEIAIMLGCVHSTVDRKLRAIREIWEREAST